VWANGTARAHNGEAGTGTAPRWRDLCPERESTRTSQAELVELHVIGFIGNRSEFRRDDEPASPLSLLQIRLPHDGREDDAARAAKRSRQNPRAGPVVWRTSKGALLFEAVIDLSQRRRAPAAAVKHVGRAVRAARGRAGGRARARAAAKFPYRGRLRYAQPELASPRLIFFLPRDIARSFLKVFSQGFRVCRSTRRRSVQEHVAYLLFSFSSSLSCASFSSAPCSTTMPALSVSRFPIMSM
jgi:hypothetical protein